MNRPPHTSFTILAAAATLGIASDSRAQTIITPRNTSLVPSSATDQNGAPFTIGSMSGITHRSGFADGGGAEFVVVMDNSDKLARIRVSFAADGSIVQTTVLGGVTLSAAGDHEGIAFAGHGANSVFVTNEVGPAVDEFSLTTGALLRTLPVPSVFTTPGNLRPNYGFESLSRRIDNGEMWTANEEALTVDGSLSTPTVGTAVRLACYGAGASPAINVQHAYTTEPMHGAAITSARSGVSDIVALPGGKLLILERSFALSGSGLFKNSIYLVNPNWGGRTDVTQLPGLLGQTFTPLSKQLMWSDHLNQNLEGLCLGPRLSLNSRVLLGVCDNGDPISTNLLISFEFTDSTECAGDFDGSGEPSIDDLFIFINAWLSGDPRTDMDGANAVSIDDLFIFINTWLAGC